MGWTSTLRATLFFFGSIEKMVKQEWISDSEAEVGDCLRHREAGWGRVGVLEEARAGRRMGKSKQSRVSRSMSLAMQTGWGMVIQSWANDSACLHTPVDGHVEAMNKYLA